VNDHKEVPELFYTLSVSLEYTDARIAFALEAGKNVILSDQDRSGDLLMK
jgi:hypothetical protein